eukprot:1184297-Prorocentrum_minimum.AAC.1
MSKRPAFNGVPESPMSKQQRLSNGTIERTPSGSVARTNPEEQELMSALEKLRSQLVGVEEALAVDPELEEQANLKTELETEITSLEDRLAKVKDDGSKRRYNGTVEWFDSKRGWEPPAPLHVYMPLLRTTCGDS